jgi:hypothetical protein
MGHFSNINNIIRKSTTPNEFLFLNWSYFYAMLSPSIKLFEALQRSLTLRKALLKQIEKDLDLETNALQVDLKDLNFINSTVVALHAHIVDIMQKQPGVVAQILYTVDVSENALHEQLRSGNHKNFEAALTSCIVHREAQKVIYRHQHSKSSNESKT